MSFVTDYLTSFTQMNRYKKSVSLFSFWDRSTKLSKKVFIAFGVRLGYCNIGDYTRIRHFSTIYFVNNWKISTISKNVRIGIGQHPTNLLSTNLIFYRKIQLQINGLNL